MEVRALLLTEDDSVIAMVSRVLDTVGISMRICFSVEQARHELGCAHYEALIFDCDDVPGATDLLVELKKDARCRTSVFFAILNRRTSVQNAFGTGATFVLDKPLSLERCLRCFRAAHGIISGERRRYFRHHVDAPVDLHLDAKNVSASAVDISSGGMCVETEQEFTPEERFELDLLLPESRGKISATCEVIWAKGSRVGLQFATMTRKDREALAAWLESQMDAKMKVNPRPLPQGPIATA